ncbi:MAG: cytochrome C [Mailhella sp.]|nr:cytochrome C [Mailhella sp.]
MAGYMLPWEKTGSQQPQKSLLQNSGGPVVFEHEKHASAGTDCIVCHHELSVSAQPMKCSSCHGVVFDDAFRADHASSYPDTACAVCHHYRNEERNCALCHADYKVAGNDWGHKLHGDKFGCEACHHESSQQSCASCHKEGTPPSTEGVKTLGRPGLADAVHNKCATCHRQWFAEKQSGCDNCHAGKRLAANAPRMHADAVFVSCSSCHKNVESAQKLVPGSMQALHKLCMGCHEKVGSGPYTKEDCSKCHMK